MAKMELGKVRIENTETGEKVEYNATKTPYKNNVGHYLCGNELKHTGMAKLQAKGFNITDDVTLRDMLISIFNNSGVGLTKDDFGRTEVWNTPEAREKFKVFVNDMPFNPEFTEKQKSKINAMEQAVPKLSNTESSFIPQTKEPTPQIPEIVVPVQAQADTVQVVIPQAIVPQIPQAIVPQVVVPQTIVPKTIVQPSVEDLPYVNKMKERIADGRWNLEQLLNSLSNIIGIERATRILRLAQ